MLVTFVVVFFVATILLAMQFATIADAVVVAVPMLELTRSFAKIG